MISNEIFDNASPKTWAIAIVALFVIFKVTKWINNERKIGALGGHARKIRSWLPGEIDILYFGVKSTIKHRNLEAWTTFFTTSKGMNYTAECTVVGRRCIFTADPENIKAILATQFADYGKGELFHREWKDFLGDSIFATDGDLWHASRQLIRPQFIKDRISDLEIFEKHVQILMDQISKSGRTLYGTQSAAFDISDLFFRYTLDAATHFLLGRSVGSLEVPDIEFAEAFSEVQRVQNIIARAGPVNALVPRKSFFAGIKCMDEFLAPIIEETLHLSPQELNTKTKLEEGYTFLHALASFTRDRKVLRDQLVAVLLAGRDTTAATLSWTFYELSRHPEIVVKLREEIIQHVGLERPPTYADLKGMKYLQNTMNETLRLYPVVPFNVRVALKDTTLPHGGGPSGLSPVGILKDTPIGYSTLLMQRRPDLTPPFSPPSPTQSTSPISHLEFSPERWQNWQPKPWTYIPFNGGPRICIGQQFALTEMGYTIVRLLQRFERVVGRMGPVDGGSPCLKAEIVLQPGQGVMVEMIEGEKGRVV